MSRKPMAKSKSGYYHIMVKGNEKISFIATRIKYALSRQYTKRNKKIDFFSMHPALFMDNHIHTNT